MQRLWSSKVGIRQGQQASHRRNFQSLPTLVDTGTSFIAQHQPQDPMFPKGLLDPALRTCSGDTGQCPPGAGFPRPEIQGPDWLLNPPSSYVVSPPDFDGAVLRGRVEQPVSSPPKAGDRLGVPGEDALTAA